MCFSMNMDTILESTIQILTVMPVYFGHYGVKSTSYIACEG